LHVCHESREELLSLYNKQLSFEPIETRSLAANVMFNPQIDTLYINMKSFEGFWMDGNVETDANRVFEQIFNFMLGEKSLTRLRARFSKSPTGLWGRMETAGKRLGVAVLRIPRTNPQARERAIPFPIFPQTNAKARDRGLFSGILLLFFSPKSPPLPLSHHTRMIVLE
jgi:hypothetical protein